MGPWRGTVQICWKARNGAVPLAHNYPDAIELPFATVVAAEQLAVIDQRREGLADAGKT
jgi:hypothetical protein